MNETIGVIYTCGECLVFNREIPVPVRLDGQDIKDWMEQTIMWLVEDHIRQSPMCKASKFKLVKIPVDGTEKVGGPQIN